MKRIFDLFFSFSALIFLPPIFVVISILIKFDSQGPVFFKQSRVGYKERRFYLYKFRTMAKDAEKKGIKLSSINDPRITKIGRLLRKYKIDELPQLINVLKGEMSFVGPRPEVPEYVELFRKDYEYILNAKPGITDFASIKFRDESKLIENNENAEDIYIKEILPQKIELNKKYIKERSFSLDIYLIFLTLFYLFKK
ncbi:UDP-glucose:undecaprenyl-phosphate glucose-1-phosphate transferase [subsurface metagenome]